MNIVVVGCGAMGSIYAALLATAGHQVSAVDTNAAHVDAINANGLRVWGASGDHTVHIKAHLSPPQDQPADLVVCAVKARYVGAAAKAMTPLVG
ncbi:MAG: ketopantoate reductase family protein, partial [Pseudomonadales bacterium]